MSEYTLLVELLYPKSKFIDFSRSAVPTFQKDYLLKLFLFILQNPENAKGWEEDKSFGDTGWWLGVALHTKCFTN